MTTENERRFRNAFTTDFLSRMDEIGEPDGAHEADVAGPWVIVPVRQHGGAGFAVLREWESLEDGDLPYAIFRRRETALLAAAMLPATGREPLYRLATDADPAGFPLWIAATSALDEARRAGVNAAAAAEVAPGPDGGRGDEPAGDADREHREHRKHREHGKVVPPDDSAGARAEPAGHLRDFDEGLAAALNLAAAMVRSPRCLALLLESAGVIALEQAGRILHRHIHRP